MVKAQWVRVADVLLLGPFSIWFGVKATSMPMWARASMIGYGAGTMLYNGWNWARYQQRALT